MGQTSPVQDRLPDKEKRLLNQFNTSSQQRAKNEINALKLLSPKGGTCPPFDILKNTNKEAHIEMKESSHSEEAQNVQNCTQPAGEASH